MRAEQMRAHQEVSCAKTRFDPGRAWSLGLLGSHAASPRPGLLKHTLSSYMPTAVLGATPHHRSDRGECARTHHGGDA